MPTAAYHTLGCKVNQYDTQAMEELLSAAGYQTVPFTGDADVYMINTCTVTGTGDRKSLQLARRIRREHPQSILVLCGCLAQLKGSALLETGADLVIGTQSRGQIVPLLEKVIASGSPVCAVQPIDDSAPFELLQVSHQSGHTRAVLKIQEGCSNRCSYCIIPKVRGNIRSRPLQDICLEARRLADAGFCEIVLTGIHLSSYGKDIRGGASLLDVVQALQQTEGILRIRLGSLEPTIATPEFSAALRRLDKVCPQFHLALQSGSDSVLHRMRRRYNISQYLASVNNLRTVFPAAAFTTDILTGFPGETEEEFMETESVIRRVGFARIHVFPYSPRPDTPASAMPGQLTDAVKQERARHLITVGEETASAYRKTWVGRETLLLPEEVVNGRWEGYTPEYLRVRMADGSRCTPGHPVRIRIESAENDSFVTGKII